MINSGEFAQMSARFPGRVRVFQEADYFRRNPGDEFHKFVNLILHPLYQDARLPGIS